MPSIAFKCAYNDGGGNDEYIGFAGTCSKGNIVNNIINEKVPWCSNNRCLCTQFYNNQLQGRRPINPCS